MQSEPLITWPKPIYELLQFVAAFLAIGPLGFRYAVARPGAAWSGQRVRPDGRAPPGGGHRRVGAVLALTHIALVLPGLAARRHTGVEALVTGDPVVAAWMLLTALAAVGLPAGLARSRRGLGARGRGRDRLDPAQRGERRVDPAVNPLHLLAGGLWIGTLFVLVAAGLDDRDHDRAVERAAGRAGGRDGERILAAGARGRRRRSCCSASSPHGAT